MNKYYWDQHLSVRGAIEESTCSTRIVRIADTHENREKLKRLADDYCTDGEEAEYWTETWRVHLIK